MLFWKSNVVNQNVCKKKYLSWVYGVNRKICHSGSLFAITRQASWCRSVTFMTYFSIHTIHPWKILIFCHEITTKEWNGLVVCNTIKTCAKNFSKNYLVTEAETIYQCEPFLNIHEYFVVRNWLTPTFEKKMRFRKHDVKFLNSGVNSLTIPSISNPCTWALFSQKLFEVF